MSGTVLLCGSLFDGVSETLSGPMQVLVENIASPAWGGPSDGTVSPGFIDTHVHLTMDAANLARQTLESSATKALKGLSLARTYMSYGFTTLRDLGSADPDWPVMDLRTQSTPESCKALAFSSRLTSLAPVRVTVICAASTTLAGHCLFPRLPMTRHP
jgi:hypothetical protein